MKQFLLSKQIWLSAILSITAIALHAQSFQWGMNAGSSFSEESYSTTTDANGNVYITGSISGDVDFDPSSGTLMLNADGFSAFMAKYDAAGSIIWAKLIPATIESESYGIDVSADGSVYITGNFAGTADFDPSAAVANLVSGVSNDAFIAKYDASGNYVWANKFSGNPASFNTSYGSSISSDANGNVYITGYFEGTVDFDGSGGILNLSANADYDVFITSYTSAGNFQWAKRMGGSSYDLGYKIVVGSNNRLYVCGDFESTVDFDPSSGTANLSAGSTPDAFLASYDLQGNYIWALKLGNSNESSATGLALDATNNVYVTGYFGDIVDFDPSTDTLNLDGGDNSNIFLAKYDANGNVAWARSFGSGDFNKGIGVAIDPSSNVFVVGEFEGTVDFNPSAAVANLTSLAQRDIFLAGYTSSGDFISARNMKSDNGFAGVHDISISADNNIYITGNFSGELHVDFLNSAQQLQSLGGNDIFLVKYKNEVLGVENIENIGFLVYPNPTNNILNIEFPQPESFAIYTITGTMVQNYPIKHIHQLDVSNYASGVYFIKTSKGVVRFIKE